MSAAADDDEAARTKGAPAKDTMNQKGNSSSISSNLKAFYESHSVSVDSILGDESSSSQHRFIRLNPQMDEKETLSLLAKEISPATPRPIPWLNGFGFYAVPASVKLSQSECFRSGRVYGMDVSSGAAVAVLMSNKYDADKSTEKSDSSRRVLDLCCAPGLKLCMLADMLVHKDDDSSMVVGVDIAPTRLNICKNIIKKYHAAHDAAATIRLYCGDGVTFGTVDKTLVFDSQVARDESKQAGKRKRMNKSARARERKRLKLIAGESSTKQQMQLFDRVLVDAECSTDGSLKHIQQQVKKHGVIDNQQLMDEDQLNELVQLQKGLIASGFRLLKPGGTLVYSTCSLSTSQNEGVVQWLLDENKLDATLIELRFPAENFIVEGSVKGTVRFVPSSADAFCGGGFFVAKIAKKE